MVENAMEYDFGKHDISFLFHVGDMIYNFGEADDYYSEFYEPYAHYPATDVYACRFNLRTELLWYVIWAYNDSILAFVVWSSSFTSQAFFVKLQLELCEIRDETKRCHFETS